MPQQKWKCVLGRPLVISLSVVFACFLNSLGTTVLRGGSPVRNTTVATTQGKDDRFVEVQLCPESCPENHELLVRRETPLYSLVNNRLIITLRLPKHAKLRVVPLQDDHWILKIQGKHLLHVQCLNGKQVIEGWVYWDRVADITAMRKRVKRLLGSSIERIPSAAFHRMPALVRLQSAEVRLIWHDLVDYLRRTPENQVTPEVYFTVAEFWSTVGSHFDALDNFARGMELAQEKHIDLATYQNQITAIRHEFREYRKSPGRPYVAEAVRHWEQGYYALVRREMDRAIVHFTDAVRLNPQRPLYWYCRTYALKQLGMTVEAQRNLEIAVNTESQLADWLKKGQLEHSRRIWLCELPCRMEPLNGEVRMWMEAYREKRGMTWNWYQYCDRNRNYCRRR